MQRKNEFTRLIPVILLILGLSVYCSTVAQAQMQYNYWQPTQPLEKGGVPQKIQLIRTQPVSGVEPEPIVLWSTNMEGNLFRSEYMNNQWGAWHEHVVPGPQLYGLDAIKIGDVEHVMTSWAGVYVGQFVTEISSFDHPYTVPTDWTYAHIHDCAFYCDNSTSEYADPPESKYFIILMDEVIDQQTQQVIANPGLYRWDNDAPGYARVDEAATGTVHSYDKIWRDAKDQNVLYSVRNTTRNAQGQITDAGRLCRIKGAYSSLNYQDLGNFTGGTSLYEVLGFSQYWDNDPADPVYSYVIVNWTSGGTTKNSIFVSTNLAGSSPTFTEVCDITDPAALSNPQLWLDKFIEATHHITLRTAGLPPLPNSSSAR